MFQWTVYKSNNGNYYLYNIGKQKFLGAASNGVFPFVDAPDSKVLTFKNSSDANYPIMFSTDNTNAVSQNANSGLFAWSSGWNKLDDDGSNHKVMLVKTLTDAELEAIASIVEDYDKALAVQVAVDGWTANNPNTHFGNVTVTLGETVSTTKLTTKNMNVGYMMYNNIGDIITFTRPYRGFDFQGFYVGEESLGKSFELTEALKNSITDANPLIAKFTATSDVTLFYDDDPKSYRIPAITTTGTGRIFAVSDYRHNLDDIGRDKHNTGTMRIDLVARYSDNNGQTWSETQTIAAGDNSKTGSYLRAFGDAAIAAIGENIVVMAAAGDQMYPYATVASPNKMARIFSSDNGQTWSITEMTSKMYTSTGLISDGVAAFFGSGKMVVDANFNGSGKARIYGALLVRRYVNEAYSNYNNYVVFSDDLGETWKILGGSQTPIASGDEPKAEILPNGQILLSARRGGGRVFNVFTYTDKANNTGTWDTAANGCGNGGSNATNGEIFCVDAKKVDGTAVKLLMQSQPKGGSGQYDRNDVTIWYKEIDANTTYTTATIKDNWIEGLQVSHQQSSYSAVTMQPNGKIALFFEEAPCYADNYEKGYSMVYVPLTVESITKGNYFSPSTDLEAATTIDVTLTDAEGNTYNDQLTDCKVGEVATTLQTKYPFITLGDNVSLTYDGTTYTYSNTVTLPFKVSNNETTVWHNIYFLSNKINQVNYPVYLSASNSDDEFVATCKDNVAGEYGDNSFNTLEYADKISWAVYQSGNGFAFKFKNKLTGKFVQTTSVATGSNKNVKYVNDADATVFELILTSNNFYAVKANVGGTDGYLCCTSAGYGFATHFNHYNHAGGTLTFAEVSNFETLIAEVNNVLSLIGTGLGKYTVTDANAETVEKAKDAMQNSNTVKLNDLIAYRDLLTGANLNKPQNGQYFRVAYDYGGSVGKLYMQGVASSVKGVQFTNETGAASIWLYYDGALYSYTAGKNLREHGDDRGLHDTKTTVEFSASTRAKGKYNVKCGSFIHANSSGGEFYSDHCSGNTCVQHDLILEEVTTLPVTISAAKYATFYAPAAVEVSEGVTAYTVTVNGDWATLNKIESGVIPANTGVVLYSETVGTYNLTITDDVEAIVSDLSGSVVTTYHTEAGTYYALGLVDGEVGFYKDEFNNSRFQNNSHKAYLYVPDATSVSAFKFRFNDNTTAIESVVAPTLDVNAPIYDLSGRRVNAATKGIYIQNGKKFIVK